MSLTGIVLALIIKSSSSGQLAAQDARSVRDQKIRADVMGTWRLSNGGQSLAKMGPAGASRGPDLFVR